MTPAGCTPTGCVRGRRGRRFGAGTPVVVECNGQTLQLHRNLFDFLCQMRDDGLFFSPQSTTDLQSISTREPFDGLSEDDCDSADPVARGRSVYLWVDAVCVNQTDTGERSHQVALMSDIYQGASGVLVWLGSAEPSEGVVWVLEFMGPLLCDLGRAEGWDHFVRRYAGLKDSDLIRKFGAGTYSEWTRNPLSFMEFFGRCLWFRRGWVVQVILKSPAHIAGVCGSKRINWRMLEHLLQFTLDYRESVSAISRYWGVARPWHSDWRFHPTQGLWRIIAIRSELRKATSAMWTEEDSWRFCCAALRLAVQLRSAEFGERKDHVYGCLAMINPLLKKRSVQVVPNYSLSHKAVFVNFALLMLQSMPDITEVLSRVRYHGPGTEDIPSWAALFLEAPVYTQVNVGSEYGFDTGSPDPFDASRTITSGEHHGAKVDKDALTLRGCRLDTIDSSGSYFRSCGFSNPEWLVRFLWREDCYHHLGQPYAEAVCVTLMVGRDALINRDPMFPAVVKQWYLHTLARSVNLIMRKGQHDGALSDILGFVADVQDTAGSEWLPSAADLSGTCRFLNDFPDNGDSTTQNPDQFVRENPVNWWIETLAVGRQLFGTLGGYICNGLVTVDEGDEIWLIKGSRVPFVLRKAERGEGYYHIVGEIYVHGVMNGEAMTEEMEQKVETVHLL